MSEQTITRQHNYMDWVAAFTIFAKYAPIDEFGVEHDVIYAGPDPELVSDEDKATLEILGWSVEEQYDCFYHFV